MMFLEKLRTMLGVQPPPVIPAELRVLIDEAASAWPFTEAAIELSPAAPGVYLLYRDGRLIYIGVAINGSAIRQALESHRRGAGIGTSDATAFTCEPAADPLALHRHYLKLHRERYGGRLPAANERELAAR
jgi:hypothetical protein